MLPMFKKKNKFEGFDRESRPRPFLAMFPRSVFWLFCRIAFTFYGLNFMNTDIDLFLQTVFRERLHSSFEGQLESCLLTAIQHG